MITISQFIGYFHFGEKQVLRCTLSSYINGYKEETVNCLIKYLHKDAGFPVI